MCVKLNLEFQKITSSQKSTQSELDLVSTRMQIPSNPSVIFKDLKEGGLETNIPKLDFHESKLAFRPLCILVSMGQ